MCTGIVQASLRQVLAFELGQRRTALQPLLALQPTLSVSSLCQ